MNIRKIFGLTQSGLLFRQGLPPQATYLFKHALVQDAAYSTLLRSFLLVSSPCCLRAFTRHALHIKHRSRANYTECIGLLNLMQGA